MNKNEITVVLTGAAGNIGSILSFMLLDNNIFDDFDKIHLRLIDLESMHSKLEAIAMEIQDSVFLKLGSITVVAETSESFWDADCIILLSGKPWSIGMEWRDLLEVNALLFEWHAKMCIGVIKPTTKVLVVANPCNTNALVFSHFLPTLPIENITALSYLDHNRALNLISKSLDIHSD